MDARTANRMLGAAVAVLAAALASCEYQITGYPPQPPTLYTCTLRRADISVTWIKNVDEAAKACGSSTTDYGCAVPLGRNSEGVPMWMLYVVQPKDFNDVPVLAVLGHEVCHGLGGKHG